MYFLTHNTVPTVLPKITLEGCIMRPLILSSVLLTSALTRKASTLENGWRMSWLKLLMVTTMSQSSTSASIVLPRCWYWDATRAANFGSFVKDIVFRRHPVGGDKGSRTREEARLGSPNYLLTACCKPCYQRGWRLPKTPSIYLPSLRLRLPAFRLTDREPRTGYSSLAVLNDRKQRSLNRQ